MILLVVIAIHYVHNKYVDRFKGFFMIFNFLISKRSVSISPITNSGKTVTPTPFNNNALQVAI